MGNSRSRIEEKQQQLEILTAQNEAANLEMIQGVKDEINPCCIRMNYFRDNAPALSSCQQVIRILNFFHQGASQRPRKITTARLMDEGG